MTTWTNPADAGTLDLSNTNVVTETHWDALRRNELILGGTTGRRPEFRREWQKAADKASAATVDLSTVEGNYVHITGTTTITAFGTVNAGTVMVLEFDGALTVTHNATSLILAGGANLTTAAGTVLVLVSEGSGNWREIARNVPRTDLVTAPDQPSTKLVHLASGIGTVGTTDRAVYDGGDNTVVFAETFSVAPLVVTGASTNGNKFVSCAYSNSTTQCVAAGVAINGSGVTAAGIRLMALGT